MGPITSSIMFVWNGKKVIWLWKAFVSLKSPLWIGHTVFGAICIDFVRKSRAIALWILPNVFLPVSGSCPPHPRPHPSSSVASGCWTAHPADVWNLFESFFSFRPVGLNNQNSRLWVRLRGRIKTCACCRFDRSWNLSPSATRYLHLGSRSRSRNASSPADGNWGSF